MITKKREEYQFHLGGGRPYEMNPRTPIEKNDDERQKPVIINLSDLNGPRSSKMFHPRRGRRLLSFRKYWSPEEAGREQEDAFDIE